MANGVLDAIKGAVKEIGDDLKDKETYATIGRLGIGSLCVLAASFAIGTICNRLGIDTSDNLNVYHHYEDD